MASTTYRGLLFDLLATFKAMQDDAEISEQNVLFWINVFANRLRMQHIRKLPTGAHLLTFNNVLVTTDTSGRKFFTLPKSVYDYKHEKGIDYITYQQDTECCDPPAFAQITFNQTTARDSKRLYMNPYEEPTSDNPYFYRIGSIIHFLGIECIDVKEVEVALYASIDPLTAGCNLDDPIDLSDELISVLKYELLNLGRFALIVPNERINQGADLTTQAVQEQGIDIPTIRQPEGLPATEQQQQQTEV